MFGYGLAKQYQKGERGQEAKSAIGIIRGIDQYLGKAMWETPTDVYDMRTGRRFVNPKYVDQTTELAELITLPALGAKPAATVARMGVPELQREFAKGLKNVIKRHKAEGKYLGIPKEVINSDIKEFGEMAKGIMRGIKTLPERAARPVKKVSVSADPFGDKLAYYNTRNKTMGFSLLKPRKFTAARPSEYAIHEGAHATAYDIASLPAKEVKLLKGPDIELYKQARTQVNILADQVKKKGPKIYRDLYHAKAPQKGGKEVNEILAYDMQRRVGRFKKLTGRGPDNDEYMEMLHRTSHQIDKALKRDAKKVYAKYRKMAEEDYLEKIK